MSRKRPSRRLRDIGEARYLLDESATPGVAAPSQLWLGIVASITAGALLIALGILSFIHFRETPPPKAMLRYTIGAPENTTGIHSFAIRLTAASLRSLP